MAVGSGLLQTWQVIELTVIGIVKLIERVIPAKEVGSFIMIAQDDRGSKPDGDY